MTISPWRSPGGTRQRPIVSGREAGFRPRPKGRRRHAEPTAACGPGEASRRAPSAECSAATGVRKTTTRSGCGPPRRGGPRRNGGQEGTDAGGMRPAGASPYGLLDTGGNMWEFCEDWWDPDYFKANPQKAPAGSKPGGARVVKGGSWDSRPTVLSASSRNFAYTGYREGDFGFRCASDPPQCRRPWECAQRG